MTKQGYFIMLSIFIPLGMFWYAVDQEFRCISTYKETRVKFSVGDSSSEWSDWRVYTYNRGRFKRKCRK